MRITYTSAGGIVGGLEKTEIAGDGRILITSKGKTSGERNLSVSPEEIAALVKVLEDAGFFDMNDKYAPDRPVPDMMSESVQYRDDTRSKTVTVISGGEVPKGWDRVIAAIKKLKS